MWIERVTYEGQLLGTEGVSFGIDWMGRYRPHPIE
jgi:hypothetical protein